MKETTTRRRGRPRKKQEPEQQPAEIIKFPLWDVCRYRRAFNGTAKEAKADAGKVLSGWLYHEGYYENHGAYAADYRIFNLSAHEKRASKLGLQLCDAIQSFFLLNLEQGPEYLEPEELEVVQW